MCPRPSKGHVCAQQDEWVALTGGWKGRSWTKWTACPSERTCVHWSYTLMLSYFILSQLLRGAQGQLPLPIHFAPGCYFPHFSQGLCACIGCSCRSWLDLFMMEGLHFAQKCLNWTQEKQEKHLSLHWAPVFPWTDDLPLLFLACYSGF